MAEIMLKPINHVQLYRALSFADSFSEKLNEINTIDQLSCMVFEGLGITIQYKPSIGGLFYAQVGGKGQILGYKLKYPPNKVYIL